MTIEVKDFLKARRDRALGSILGHAEREIYTYIPDDKKRVFRSIVIDALNSYHDTALDLFKSEGADIIRNEEVVRILDRLNEFLDREEEYES